MSFLCARLFLSTQEKRSKRFIQAEKEKCSVTKGELPMPIMGERFFQMSNAIFCYDLTPIQLAVYSYLKCCAGQKEKCWPGMKTIAFYCGCSENAAREAIKVLHERRFIKKVITYRESRNGKRHQANNTYFILELPPLKIAS